jgi:hypothetical protein
MALNFPVAVIRNLVCPLFGGYIELPRRYQTLLRSAYEGLR